MEKFRAGDDVPATLTQATSATSPWDPAETAQARSQLEPGSYVDRYRIVEFLGEGSMGRVYRARDTDLGRDVALKQLNPGKVNLASAQERLRREARAMARVEHAAVVRIYDTVVVDDELFVAMELARGGTLAAWIAARPRSWREIVGVFVEAGRGLAAAHRVGLVHRDIKPGNVLLVDVVGLDDVRVVQRSDGAGLAVEALQGRRVLGPGDRQDLDGHAPAHVPVLAQVDSAHAARAELLENFVFADRESPPAAE